MVVALVMVLDTVVALVMAEVITWARVVVMVLVTVGAPARCGNRQNGSRSRTTSEASCFQGVNPGVCEMEMRVDRNILERVTALGLQG